jgi:hypothetical protein
MVETQATSRAHGLGLGKRRKNNIYRVLLRYNPRNETKDRGVFFGQACSQVCSVICHKKLNEVNLNKHTNIIFALSLYLLIITVI